MLVQNIRAFLASIKSAFMETMRTIRTFNTACDVIEILCAPYVPLIPNPEILELSERTLLDYREAETIYNLSQDYNIDIEQLIPLCLNRGKCTAIRRVKKEGMARKQAEYDYGDEVVR